jgi:hypothetical protein
LEGRGIDPRPVLDGSGVKVMPGSIPEPNPGSFNVRKERKYRWPKGAHQKKSTFLQTFKVLTFNFLRKSFEIKN